MEKRQLINELLSDIKNKKVEVRELLATRNLSGYTSTLSEIEEKENNLYQLLSSYDERDNTNQNAFINALQVYTGVKRSSEIDQPIIDYMREKIIENEGILITSDIQTDVKILRRDKTNLEDYVNIEPVHSIKGTRVYEISENTSLEIVEPLEVIPKISKDDLVNVDFEIKKRAGRVAISNELLSDSSKAVLSWLKKWLSKKTRVTRNKAIIDKANEITEGKEVQVTTSADLKNIFNKTLDTAYVSNAIVITNQGGYDFIDGLCDANGNNTALKVENRKPLLFGLYPVIRVPDYILPNDTTTGAYPILCGDFEAAITLYDKENLMIDMSAEAGTLFTSYKTEIRVEDYFDVKAVDENAIIKAIVPYGGSGN